MDSPLSLLQLARTSVHTALRPLPRTAVPLLPLPESLRAYLLFPDLDLPALLQAFEETWHTIRGTSVDV